MSIKIHSLPSFSKIVMPQLLCSSFLSVEMVMFHVLFFTTGKDWLFIPFPGGF